ncbi:cell division protein FtsZ [Meridianimarinicoccus aquatilis]|uniref:Cell division protein FtsZ n=1 Tax=Meridianimarinicoccus aquatilis TaxID=2552766 RepID=A0A4R6AQX8_9RHOB|nr:cell division protein FtsZ [Fluviibacterium aquatile]QIE41692.1 cell division protein FtsZ [Rhodobacteraceae bacterium SC52]TDL86297.1 cell division protein FtsZ [Fluviibacterium aquatile]
MTLNLTMPEQDELKPKITVFGVGGAGGNAVNNMIEKQLDGVEFVVANTDAQALQQNQSPAKVQMGLKVTEGLGAGARPQVGAAAAEESIEQIVDHLVGSHMCFITAGMGGGTGTGAAPIIAQAARELGVLTVGVVTKPFQFEGAKRMRKAEEGVEALQKVVDTLIIIPNQNLFRLANEKTTFTEAFSMADDVLYQGVKGVTDLMVRPGLINLDFADVRAVMDEMGKAMMGTGEGEGETRAVQAAEKAIANPLLDEISLRGARGVLINITGGYDLTLFELDEAANRIREEVDPDANIIVGSTLDPDMNGTMRVSVVATGIDAAQNTAETPVPRRRISEPLTNTVSAEADKGALPEQVELPAVAADASPEMPLAASAADAQPQVDSAGLFRDLDLQPTQTPQQIAADDGLPPPAYVPQQPEVAQASPQAPAPGTPSPETIRRLEAAVRKTPEGAGPRTAAPAPVATPAAHGADKSRFGINSLINRMTGQSHDPRAQGGRSQPPMQSLPQDQPEDDAELDKIEIPAFLRRQAN